PPGAPIGAPAPAVPPPRPGVIPPNAVGVAPPAPPSSWFTTGDRPNMDVAGGGRSNRMQGGVLSPGGGPATMGMLDLSGLFGGSAQPTAAPPRKIKISPAMRAEVPEESPG